jgi:hypothetical protein
MRPQRPDVVLLERPVEGVGLRFGRGRRRELRRGERDRALVAELDDDVVLDVGGFDGGNELPARESKAGGDPDRPHHQRSAQTSDRTAAFDQDESLKPRSRW